MSNVLRGSRPCDGCRVCCTPFSIPELNKPAGVPCVHLTKTGCGIYDTRPQTCRNYTCVWQRAKPAKPKHRPDRSGIVIDIRPIAGKTEIVAQEVQRNALRRKTAQKMIGIAMGFTHEGYVVVQPLGDFMGYPIFRGQDITRQIEELLNRKRAK